MKLQTLRHDLTRLNRQSEEQLKVQEAILKENEQTFVQVRSTLR